MAPLLEGGLSTLPLAPVADVPEAEVPGIIHRVRERIEREAGTEAPTLLATTYILTGLRHLEWQVQDWFKGVTQMRESSTYQAILAEGRTEGEAEGEAKGETKGVKKTLLRQGRERFGEPTPETTAAIEAITDLDRLHRLTVRVLDVTTWDELLADA